MKQRFLLALAALVCGTAHAESVPLIHEHGIFLVPVVINGEITLKFTVDSGAADVSVPADVVSTLQRTGTISKGDFLDSQVYELADGSTHVSRRFQIRSLRIGSLELHNVVASVAPAEGSLLLGQSFLSRLKTWSMDNERHMLVFNEPPARNWDTQTTQRPVSSVRTGVDPPQSAALAQASDGAILKAVAFALTGDDSRHVQDWPDCVYVIKSESPAGPVFTFRLNNIDPERLKVVERTDTETDVHLSGEDTIVDEYSVNPDVPLNAMGGNKVLLHHSQWTLKVPTNEPERLLRAWRYIYSHGCTGHKGSF
jgi:clan AA aspartic protease (TIGR02281 family)